MNRQATVETWALPAGADEGGFKRNALSLVLGVGVTLALFLGIAHYERGAPANPPVEVDDLRVAVMPVSPPPVPVPPVETQPQAAPLAGFEYSPTDSPVSIAVSPPDLDRLLPEDLSKAPPVTAQFNLRLADLRPKMDLLNDAQHIYQKGEVDRPPNVLSRTNPQVSSRVRDNADVLRVTLLVVIDTEGEAGNVRMTKSSGNPEFDAIMAEYIRSWVFSPAIKGGRKVRCMIEQRITIQWKSGSPFQS
jgi:TonB family protein